MNLEDIRNKYQCDEGRTFAQWKEWVRKNKPSQAQAHIVKAVSPNGSKYERVIGGYTDAQNTAFDLVSHGYKDVKLYHSVNAGPLKLLRNFSAPLHGVKFKDSAYSVDEIFQKYENDASLSQKKDQPVKVTNISIKPSPVGGFEGNVYYSKNGETDLYSPWHIMANGKWGFPFGRSSTRLTQSDKKLIEQKIKKLVSQKGVKVKDSVDAVDSIRQKYAKDAAFGIKVKGNEKGSERLTMEKVFKELNPAPAWKKVKKGNTIVIRTNINGKDQDVVTIKYFNPNIVAMTPRGGAANMVALKDVSVMCGKLGVEGRRSYNDSADGVERIRAKYSTDAYNLGMETKEFDPKAQLKVLSVTTKKEPDGISGRVTFTKGKKKTSERFMVYKSGNWDVTPGGGFGITGLTAGDKQALMNAVRNKLSTMGIKAR